MSIVVNRPRVKKVAVAQVPPHAVRAAELIAAMRPQLDEAAQAVLSQITVSGVNLPDLSPRIEFPNSIPSPDTLGPVEKLKAETLSAIASVPCFIDNSHAFRSQVAALTQAQSIKQAARERKKLLAEVADSHRRVFLQSLEQSCTEAAQALGFNRIERVVGPLGERRMIGTDEQGRGIVVEIHADRRGDVALASEVIGVTDDNCGKLMGRFEKELERVGVLTGAPERRATHGVAQLSVTREFLRKKVDQSVRRAQRLNQHIRGRVCR